MREVDINYKKNIEYIIESSGWKKVRAKYKDGKDAYTKSQYHMFSTYDNVEFDFPITNFRKIPYKSAIKEILWIFRDRTTDLDKLGLKIWDSWKYDDTNDLGMTYGKVLSKEYKGLKNDCKEVFGDKENLNLIENLFKTLIFNPYDRRMVISMFDNDELLNTKLPPCMFQYIFSVDTNDALNLCVIQRSGDSLVASNSGSWNEVQSSFLLILIAKCCGFKVGKYSRIVIDNHIYDRHYYDNNLEQYLSQKVNDNKIKLKLEVKHKDLENKINKIDKLKCAWDNFHSFIDEYELIGYVPNDYKLNLEVAI